MTFSYEKAKAKYNRSTIRTLKDVADFGFDGIDASLRECMDYGVVTTKDDECGCFVVLLQPRTQKHMLEPPSAEWFVVVLRQDFDPLRAWPEDMFDWDGIRRFVGDSLFPAGYTLAEVLVRAMQYWSLEDLFGTLGSGFEIDEFGPEHSGAEWKTCLTARDVRGDEVLPVWVRFEKDAGVVSFERGAARAGDDGISVDLEGGEQLLNCDEVPGPNNCMFAERTVL